MKKYKATGIVFIRKFLQGHKEFDEKELTGQLSDEEYKCYSLALTNQWVLLEHAEQIVRLTAQLIFPDDEECIEKLSMLHAQDSINGIYKMVFRFLTPAFVISQTARVWKTYNNYGKASFVLDDAKRTGIMIVEECPDMSITRQKMVTGYIKGVMSLTNANSYKLKLDATNPNKLLWKGSWETV